MTQSPELQQLIKTVQIEKVRLLQCTAQTRINAKQVTPSELLIRHGAKLIQGIDENGRFLVEARVEVRLVPNAPDVGETPEPSVMAQFLHELTYFVPRESSFTNEVLTEFARLNGVFNVWPYWRQQFQSLTSEMGLPPVIFPVFRPGNTGGRLKPEEPSPATDSALQVESSSRAARKKRPH